MGRSGYRNYRTSSIQLGFITDVRDRMDQEGRRQGEGIKSR